MVKQSGWVCNEKTTGGWEMVVVGIQPPIRMGRWELAWERIKRSTMFRSVLLQGYRQMHVVRQHLSLSRSPITPQSLYYITNASRGDYA